MLCKSSANTLACKPALRVTRAETWLTAHRALQVTRRAGFQSKSNIGALEIVILMQQGYVVNLEIHLHPT